MKSNVLFNSKVQNFQQNISQITWKWLNILYLCNAIPGHYFPPIQTEHYCLRQIFSAFSLRRVTTFFEYEMKISYISIYSESKNMESIQVKEWQDSAGRNSFAITSYLEDSL